MFVENKKGIKCRKFFKYVGVGIGFMIGGVYLICYSWWCFLYVMVEDMIVFYSGDLLL